MILALIIVSTIGHLLLVMLTPRRISNGIQIVGWYLWLWMQTQNDWVHLGLVIGCLVMMLVFCKEGKK